MSLHDDIMNLRCDPVAANVALDQFPGYRLGHRDARHKAAEVVNYSQMPDWRWVMLIFESTRIGELFRSVDDGKLYLKVRRQFAVRVEEDELEGDQAPLQRFPSNAQVSIRRYYHN